MRIRSLDTRDMSIKTVVGKTSGGQIAILALSTYHRGSYVDEMAIVLDGNIPPDYSPPMGCGGNKSVVVVARGGKIVARREYDCCVGRYLWRKSR